MSVRPSAIVERVRWSDVDRARIVYFAKYVRWLEIAEAEYLRDRGWTYDRLETEHGLMLARVHLEIDYRKPAFLDDELTCWGQLERIGNSSLHFRFPIERAGERLVDIGLVLACLDTTTLKPVRVPADLAAVLGEEHPATIGGDGRDGLV